MPKLLEKLLAFTLASALSISAFAGELTGRDVMQKVKDREDGNNSVMDMEMILIDRKGNQRVRKIRSYSRDSLENPDDTQGIMFFLSPADVKDTGFLTFDYDDDEKDDDQWLYLPALKKVKRIAASDKSSSFMGSDFTYADMSSPNIDNYDYTIMKEVDIDGKKAWQIQAIPNTEKEKERTGYTKSVLFVDQEKLMVVRAVNWVTKGNKLKYMEAQKIENIDGIWTTTEVTMTTRKGKQLQHKSVIRSTNVKYNQELDDELFTERRLVKGA